MNHKNILSLLAVVGMLSCVSMVGMDIWDAAAEGDLARVQYHIGNGVAVGVQDVYGSTPLHLAANRGFLEMTKYLISKEAPIAIKDKGAQWTPLHLAALNGHLEVVKHLCELFKCTTSSPLYNWQQASKLLAFLNIKDMIGRTALDIAEKRDWQTVADYLTQIKKVAEAVKSPLFMTLKEGQKVDTRFMFGN